MNRLTDPLPSCVSQDYTGLVGAWEGRGGGLIGPLKTSVLLQPHRMSPSENVVSAMHLTAMF